MGIFPVGKIDMIDTRGELTEGLPLATTTKVYNLQHSSSLFFSKGIIESATKNSP